ncbi:hypothetical protein A2U01_0113969, partial [Trifolium medium]|nr:hypothetical protein [Trifolium medium]
MHFAFLPLLRGVGSGYDAESTRRRDGVDDCCHGSRG